MKLKVEHLPFHGAYGRRDEIKVPESVTAYYEVKTDEIIDLEKFKIRVIEVNDNNIKAIVFDNKGVKDNEKVDWNNNESELLLTAGEEHILYLDVMDCQEDWTLSLIRE